MNNALKKFAVIGNPIEHSLSPFIHGEFAQQCQHQIDYQKIHCQADEFEQVVTEFFKHGGTGLNITAPFKQAAAQLMSKQLNHEQLNREQLNSVNTLWLSQAASDAGVITGCSTDGIGFIKALSGHNISLADKRLLIIGAGGVTQALLPAIGNTPYAHIHIANRTPEKYQTWLTESISGSELSAIPDEPFDIVINALSIKDAQQYPSLNVQLTVNAVGYDINYGESALAFKQAFAQMGGNSNRFIDGWGMLVEQAAESYKIWHGMRPNTQQLIANGPPA